MPKINAPAIQPMTEKEIISKHFSNLSKKRWGKMSATQRSEFTSKVVQKRWDRITKKDRKLYLAGIGFGGDTRPKNGRVAVPARKRA